MSVRGCGASVRSTFWRRFIFFCPKITNAEREESLCPEGSPQTRHWFRTSVN